MPPAVAVNCDWWRKGSRCASRSAIALHASGEPEARSGSRRASRANASRSPETRGNTSESPTRESRGRSASVPSAARPSTSLPAAHQTSWQFPSARSPTPTFRRRASRSGSRASTRGSRCRPTSSITPEPDPPSPSRSMYAGPEPNPAPGAPLACLRHSVVWPARVLLLVRSRAFNGA
jgi:hypothetical protein